MNLTKDETRQLAQEAAEALRAVMAKAQQLSIQSALRKRANLDWFYKDLSDAQLERHALVFCDGDFVYYLDQALSSMESEANEPCSA